MSDVRLMLGDCLENKKPLVTAADVVSRATLGLTPKRFSPSSLVFIGQPVLRTFLKCKHPRASLLFPLDNFSLMRSKPRPIEAVGLAIYYSMSSCCSPLVWLPISGSQLPATDILHQVIRKCKQKPETAALGSNSRRSGVAQGDGLAAPSTGHPASNGTDWPSCVCGCSRSRSGSVEPVIGKSLKVLCRSVRTG
jgi:hypothetical protein